MLHIVQVDSCKPNLQDRALIIFELCLKHGINLEMEWIPRHANEICEQHQRFDDWMLNPSLSLSTVIGAHTQWTVLQVSRTRKFYDFIVNP